MTKETDWDDAVTSQGTPKIMGNTARKEERWRQNVTDPSGCERLGPLWEERAAGGGGSTHSLGSVPLSFQLSFALSFLYPGTPSS